jgi:hypothetical protein
MSSKDEVDDVDSDSEMREIGRSCVYTVQNHVEICHVRIV